MKISLKSKKCNKLTTTVMVLALVIFITYISGCVSTSGTAMKSHQESMGSVMENEYVIPKKPIDRHYIGCAWSKQFGPIEDPSVADIRIRKEKSFSNMQQDFAVKTGLGLGGQIIAGPKAEAGISGSSEKKAKLGGVEIIKPFSLADIPFEPKIPYITEALRLANFKLKEEKASKASISATAGTAIGSGTALAEAGSEVKRGTEGEGLVVAYKLHTIDPGKYEKNDSGSLPLELNKMLEFPESQLFVKAQLNCIEAGGKRSLPRNTIWSCARADAKSRNMIAAWFVKLKSTDPKKKSMTIAFPAFPKIEDCYSYSGTIYSRIDPLTDKIHRQKLNITIIDADVSDTLQPTNFDARISVIDESFKIKLVTPSKIQ